MRGVINILCTGVESVTLQLCTLLKYKGNKRKSEGHNAKELLRNSTPTSFKLNKAFVVSDRYRIILDDNIVNWGYCYCYPAFSMNISYRFIVN